MSAVKYDLAVDGSGPSGQRAAVAASKMKKRVVVIESRSVVGGVCINTGTIPSKTMREAVMHLSGYNYRSIYGMNYRVKEKNHHGRSGLPGAVGDQDRGGCNRSPALAQWQSTWCTALLILWTPHQLRVEGPQGDTTVEAGKIIVAVGTRPASSPKVPINGRTIINSDQVLDLPTLPRSLIVVGGGVIGVEYACMFAILGVRVTLVEKRGKLLEFADQRLSSR